MLFFPPYTISFPTLVAAGCYSSKPIWLFYLQTTSWIHLAPSLPLRPAFPCHISVASVLAFPPLPGVRCCPPSLTPGGRMLSPCSPPGCSVHSSLSDLLTSWLGPAIPLLRALHGSHCMWLTMNNPSHALRGPRWPGLTLARPPIPDIPPLCSPTSSHGGPLSHLRMLARAAPSQGCPLLSPASLSPYSLTAFTEGCPRPSV